MTHDAALARPTGGQRGEKKCADGSTDEEKYSRAAQIYQSGVGMNPANRFKARGSDESRTGAIPIKDARRARATCTRQRALF